jgi:hypothetical protein
MKPVSYRHELPVPTLPSIWNEFTLPKDQLQEETSASSDPT